VTPDGRAELGRRLVDRAYLEGDFVLRSGRRSRYYLDKYRFETEPELLAGLGRELAAMVRSHAPGDRGRGHLGGRAAVRNCGSESRKSRRLCCNCGG
jgi:hypothetical protein